MMKMFIGAYGSSSFLVGFFFTFYKNKFIEMTSRQFLMTSLIENVFISNTRKKTLLDATAQDKRQVSFILSVFFFFLNFDAKVFFLK